MASRSYALIDGTSRKNYFESQGNTNLSYWDDPSYYNPSTKLKANSPAYKDNVVEKDLIEPQKFGKPYLGHEDITKIVSKQFASDIHERSYASGSGSSKVVFALVFVGSTIIAMGVMDTIVYAYPRSNPTLAPACFSSTTVPQGLMDAAWIWVTSGVWAGLLPVLFGLMSECSKQSSNADYIHTFDPVLRVDGTSGEMKSTNKRNTILTVVSIILLVLGFISSIIDLYTFSSCATVGPYIYKIVPPVLVLILCLIEIILLIILMKSGKKLAGTNSNYDRRDYDMTFNYGLYYSDKNEAGKPTMQVENTVPAVVQPPVPVAFQQPQQPLVTIVDQTPNYPFIPPPPPPARPLGLPIFAGGLPVRATPYQRPMFYQMP